MADIPSEKEQFARATLPKWTYKDQNQQFKIQHIHHLIILVVSKLKLSPFISQTAVIQMKKCFIVNQILEQVVKVELEVMEGVTVTLEFIVNSLEEVKLILRCLMPSAGKRNQKNPLFADGYASKSITCKSIYHWAKDCANRQGASESVDGI